MADDPLLKPADAAQFLNVEIKTLTYWRCKHAGPTFIRIGNKRGAIRYRTSDLRDYLDRQSVTAAA